MSSDTIIYQTKIKVIGDINVVMKDWIDAIKEDYSNIQDAPESLRVEMKAYKSVIQLLELMKVEAKEKFDRRIR